ncbi:MAG: bifunctional enoyl-CoA hydratase/phosphate acetyltransferase [Bacteroidales bacterium]|nr:bifunctional enoyl-CoA hydratase/phosphate acetyltransferase [Bacteroidales bacterium]MDD4213521.1 bifunctional enoyl-CoA hydratase/phosphate acetyltransferase [Bacteroidales bacterium]
MQITRLEQMLEILKSRESKRLVAAYANDSHTIGAISKAIDLGLVEATLVGDKKTIEDVCKEMNIKINKFKIVQEADEMKAAEKAVELINSGEGKILMKGLVSSDKYMRAILNKEKGLMVNSNATLSHVTVIETPRYPKLLIVSDVAIIPLPDLKQKIAILNFIIQTAHALGIDNPKIAVLAATEQVSLSMPACIDAAILSKMADRGQIKGGTVDGPLAMDVCIDMESVQIKKLKSPVAGDADGILFPNIESGNVFFKANTKLAGAELGAVVVGAKVPAILTSRGDSEKTKMYSIALAAMMA